jgi:nucleotide-binding universal stress UspA family protein
MTQRRIVVGVDESDGAAHALRWAVEDAAFDDALVNAVLVWGPFSQHHLLDDSDWDAAYGESEAHAAVVRYVDMAVGGDAAERIDTRAVVNLPAPGLIDAAAAADLLVVGARGLGGFRELLLGSVSQQCLHRAGVPTAVIRPPQSASVEPSGRVVAAIDGSDHAQRALRWAIASARRRHATLDVVHAWQLPLHAYTPYGRSFYDVEVVLQASERMLDSALAAEDIDGVSVNPMSLQQQTVPAILEVADGADVLVVGSRGRGAVQRTMFGSVATQVSHHSPCPLVVVPAPD